MRLNDEPFELIRLGIKTIELRLYDEKRRAVAPKDRIEFIKASDESQRILSEVLDIHLFPSFRELYAALQLLKCGYTEKDIASASYTDMEKYYAREEEEKLGVVGIEIKVIA